MMSQYATELCTLLIEDNFGELFASWLASFGTDKLNVSQRIFSTLQRYERLSFPRLKLHTRLPDRQLRHALAAMIHHHLVYNFTSIEDGNTYYEANPHTAYYLVRSGKILSLVENRLGEYAARVLEAIMFLGHTSVRHLETLPELRTLQPAVPNGVSHNEVEPQENGMEVEETVDEPNGNHVAEEKPAPFHSTLRALASHGYLMRVRDAHFQSPSDNWLEAQRTAAAQSDIKALKGKKQEEAILLKTQEMVNQRTQSDLTEGLMVNGVPRGVKRKFDHASSGLSNGQLVDHNGTNGDHAAEEDEEENEWSEDEDGFDNIPMESGLVVRVNYEKLDVALRNTRFVNLAEQDGPSVTAQIYECLLRRIEYMTYRCRDSVEIPREGEEGEQYSVSIDTQKLMQDLDPHLDLSGSIGPADPPHAAPRGGKRSLENGVNGNHEDHQDSDEGEVSAGPSRAYEINQHLNLLAYPPFNLTSKTDPHGIVKWRVGFRGLARKLRHLELERLIETRYGDVALRVVRVLHAKGKLDEKRLQEISMLPFKELRQTLSGMQSGGFVDLQEVPKDAQRQPSKTIFLWYHDPDRVCSSILEDTYKAMSRTLQRIRVERDRIKDFLEKTERSDVKGHEEEYLTEPELELLQRWRDKEALLLAEVSRLDDMVAVFRDY
ncbi:hypothetical protein N7492_000814 [Penicillium capsulatum]|uniref:DNA-directed RNA polymerase III subunit RPC3 n=1 Tax=Penicillium capsulatum TaxID=69766 RepID=A0A9W9IS06_9EURO|nr:hypothetical protein N7492_000814 [Penicillium capsulatum]KAJ6130127.1 hypothetical protein N7512_002907 [Penicillium capsulatum]